MTVTTEIRDFRVEFTEKEIVNVDIVEKELVEVNFSSIDLIPRKTNINELEDIDISNPTDNDLLQYDVSSETWVNTNVTTILDEQTVYGEIPTKVSSVRFTTDNNFIEGTLKVYLNGVKEKSENLTRINANTFELSEAIETDDLIEVDYLKA